MTLTVVTFNAHCSYWPDSDCTQMRYAVSQYHPLIPATAQQLHVKEIELLSGCGTPAMVATPLIRDALIAWQKAIYNATPF